MWKPIPNSTTNTENLILWIDTVKDALLKGASFFLYTPMHEVTPKVVAMAVSTVITMFRILLQSSFFSMIELSYKCIHTARINWLCSTILVVLASRHENSLPMNQGLLYADEQTGIHELSRSMGESRNGLSWYSSTSFCQFIKRFSKKLLRSLKQSLTKHRIHLRHSHKSS